MEQTSVKLLYLEIKERHLIMVFSTIGNWRWVKLMKYIYIWRDIFLKTKSLTLSLYSSQFAGNTYPMKITTPISSEEKRVSTCFPKKNPRSAHSLFSLTKHFSLLLRIFWLKQYKKYCNKLCKWWIHWCMKNLMLMILIFFYQNKV